MDKRKSCFWLKLFLYIIFILVLGCIGLILAIFNSPLSDPAPPGEGSYQESEAITRQFRDFYRTKDAAFLPQGYVRMEGLGENGLDDTWFIYYATASHGWIRGGTIGLLGSDGRIDIYFGHHCSSGDGGKVILPEFDGPFYEGGVNRVRDAFAKTFKHQRTVKDGE